MTNTKTDIQTLEDKQNAHIQKLRTEIEPLRQQLLHHKVYQNISSIKDLKIFLEHHVFAVWDFMSLLKSLQNELTCVQVPWIPKGNPLTRRLINEIVLAEETDQDENGNAKSHFELYIEAMNDCKADISKITYLIQLLKEWKSVRTALSQIDIATSIKEFVSFSFDVIETKKAHKIAVVFTFGREDLIPDMFTSILRDMKAKSSHDAESIKKLVYYFDRHIELDGDHHSHMSIQMIKELCGDDETKWNDAIAISKIALQKRIDLWDGILNEIVNAK
ncbi:MAG: heme oxygenase [Flexibacter sp. CG_4_10_14_3_um_filter_32_15]|nr:MAG: heme oxygenase [Flexibacter sp. CG_4_10_14_3_um_filter_32_15]